MLTNPILRSPKNFFLYLFFWLLITALYVNLLNFGSDVDFYTSIIDSLVFNILLSGLGLSFWYTAKYIPFESNKLSKVVVSHLIGSVFATTIWLLLGYYIVRSIFFSTEDYELFFFNTLSWRFLIGLLIYFLLTAFYYVTVYYTGFQERAIKESELKSLVTEAELRSLKFQINPHFIFNSLNSMSALTEIDPKKAKQMILKLADFLRYTLANNERQKNKLSEEIKNIRLYLDIEKIRFEDKFEFLEDVQAECEKMEIPNMILQPLFENAIKHAVYETLDKVLIKLHCKEQDSFLKIEVENDFEGESIKKGAGVGLKNIAERLKLFYHQDNLMNVSKDDAKFKVTIFIPLDEKAN